MGEAEAVPTHAPLISGPIQRMAKPTHSFWSDFRLFFVRGLAVLLPSIVTLWLLFQAFLFLYNNVAAPINAGIRLGIVEVTPRFLSEANLPDWFRVTNTEIAEFKENTTDPLLRKAEEPKLRTVVRTQKLASFWDTWAFGVLRLTGLAGGDRAAVFGWQAAR